MLTVTRLGLLIPTVAALASCGGGGRDEPVEGRVPTEIPSGIEKALREVPPGLRSTLQEEISCERMRSRTAGRRFVLDAGTVRSLTERLSTHAPRCMRGDAPTSRGDPSPARAN